MPQRIRLLATCQVNGAIHGAGEIVVLPDGQRGPHRTVVASNHGAAISDGNPSNLIDQPLFVVIDEAIEKEREDMRTRHAEERNAIDHTDDRAALSRKQGEEAAALELKAAESELHSRHEQEATALTERQERETAAFEARAQTAPLANAPAETSKEALDKRHAAEAETLEKKHEAEVAALETRKAPVAVKETPYQPPRTSPGDSYGPRATRPA